MYWEEFFIPRTIPQHRNELRCKTMTPHHWVSEQRETLSATAGVWSAPSTDLRLPSGRFPAGAGSASGHYY